MLHADSSTPGHGPDAAIASFFARIGLNRWKDTGAQALAADGTGT
jgi:hypothetical protein